MISVSKHLRIVQPHVGDDDVEKKTAAVKALAAALNKVTNIPELLAFGDAVANGFIHEAMPDAFADQVEAAIQEKSPSFLRAERPLENVVVAAMAVHEAFGGHAAVTDFVTIKDVIAVGVWLALSNLSVLVEPKLEALRVEVMESARGRVLAAATAARERTVVRDFDVLPDPAGEEVKLPAAFAKATQATISALRSNAVLDREEIDVLWWVLAERSQLMGKNLSALPKVSRAILAAFELSGLLRRLPSQAHRDLVLRGIDRKAQFDLAALIEGIGEAGRAAIVKIAHPDVKTLSHVFVLVNAFNAGVEKGSATSKRSLEDWSARALLEASLLHRWQHGIAKL